MCDHRRNNQNETRLSDESTVTNNKLKYKRNMYYFDRGVINRALVDRLVKRQITIFPTNCKCGGVDLNNDI